MGLETDTVSLCYRGGFLGWCLLIFVKFAAFSIWAGFGWFALHSKELLFIIISQSFWFSVILQFTVASYIVKATPDPAGCNNDVLASPPLLIWLLYHYMSMAVVFEFLENMPSDLYGWIQRLFFAIGIPTIWIYNGNATIEQSVYAALLGTFVGAFIMLDAYVFWDPQRKVLADWGPLKWCGIVYHQNIHDSYTVSTAKRKLFL